MPDLPVVGKVPKGWVIAVGGISAAVLGYAYYKHRQNASAANTATTATTAPPAANPTGDPYPADGTYGDPTDPNSTDPETGMTYGDESLYGGGGYGTSGYGTAAGYYPGTTTGDTGGVQGPGSFLTNADWAQYAEQQLSGVVNATTLSAALGKYLTGQPVTTDQESLIDQAIAIAGYPPVAGAGNFPPSIKTGGTTTTGTVTVPNVVGKDIDNADQMLAAAGLNYNKNVPFAKKGYTRTVTSANPKVGASVAKGTYVSLNWHYEKA